jgi:hypothetical protein
VEPLARLKIREPEYVCAAEGLNVTEPVRLWPGFRLTGKEVPEKENWAVEEKMLEIVMLCRFSFVKVTVRGALVEPTDSLPKLTDEGPTLTFARAAVPKASKIVMAAATA